MTIKHKELLKQIASCYTSWLDGHRALLLHCGELCWRYVKHRRVERTTAILEIEQLLSEIGKERANVNDMIRTAAIVKLLKVGKDVPYNVLRAMQPLIDRVDGEEFVWRAGGEKLARELLENGDTREEITRKVGIFRWGELPCETRHEPAPREILPLAEMATKGTAKDVADMCFQLITAHSSPKKVVDELMALLQKAKAVG